VRGSEAAVRANAHMLVVRGDDWMTKIVCTADMKSSNVLYIELLAKNTFR
jgi:hypothetical protein